MKLIAGRRASECVAVVKCERIGTSKSVGYRISHSNFNAFEPIMDLGS